ncbi:hypothetical protein DM992_13100 [Burkholderia sp. JP2-270]|nr:hypothetical protein DM992_13100 [Burkholderia sp. JP2-270]
MRAAARDRTCSTSHASICSTLGERDGPYAGNRTIAQVDLLGIASGGARHIDIEIDSLSVTSNFLNLNP